MHDPLLGTRAVSVSLPWQNGSCCLTLVDPATGQVVEQRHAMLTDDGQLDLALGRDLLVILKR